MSDIARRNRGNKRRGSAWETLLRTFLVEQGLDAERVARKGSSDIGDIVIRLEDGHHIVIEAKDVARYDFAQWVAEAEVEAHNYAQHRRINEDFVHPVVIYKRRRHGVEKAYVVMELGAWVNSL